MVFTPEHVVCMPFTCRRAKMLECGEEQFRQKREREKKNVNTLNFAYDPHSGTFISIYSGLFLRRNFREKFATFFQTFRVGGRAFTSESPFASKFMPIGVANPKCPRTYVRMVGSGHGH